MRYSIIWSKIVSGTQLDTHKTVEGREEHQMVQ